VVGERRARKTEVQVVAFSDPNEVLRYLVPNAGPERYFNVIISNDVTYVGAIENPATAHLGYYQNRNVWDVVANGVSGGSN
jgi:hypothetical protein